MAGGKKRSADEADVATREDGAKRRENTGSTKKRERCTQSTRFKFAWTTLTGRGPVATQAGAIPASDSKARTVPLHVVVTRTPPAARDENSASPALVDDTDLLGALAL
ncbi:hypothetical protein V8E52_006437 [Russula decolorans]